VHAVSASASCSPLAFSGDFETHLTLSARAGDRIGRLTAFAARRGIKCVHIVLDGGQSVSQPMLTLTGQGVLGEQVSAARSLARDLARAGFEVVRIKVEAAPWNEGVPADDASAISLGHGLYFEHHVKLVLDRGADTRALSALIASFGARLSRNARRRRDDGMAEWFATQRCYQVGLATAGARLAALTGSLEQAGYALAEVEREFVVYDDAPSVDDGWLTPEKKTW
jgi:hypothetical protein